MKLSDDFRGLASCTIGSGNTVGFWDDVWDFGLLKMEYPQLHSFVVNRAASFADFVSRPIEQNFLLPLSIIASEQMMALSLQLSSLQIQHQQPDQWHYLWGTSFSCKQAYMSILGSQPAPVHFKWLWKCSVRSKHKFFFWLLMLDSLNTRNML